MTRSLLSLLAYIVITAKFPQTIFGISVTAGFGIIRALFAEFIWLVRHGYGGF